MGDLRLSMVGLVFLLAASPLCPAFGADTVRQAVEAGNRAFVQAFDGRDAAKLASLYTENGAVLPPGAEKASGRDAIRKFWQGAMDGGLTHLTLRTTEVEARGDLAYEMGLFSLDAPDKSGKLSTASGKYVVVWKRSKTGAWRLHRDIWNETPSP